MEDEIEEMHEMTDEDFNKFLEILAKLYECCSSTDEAVEVIRSIKVSENGSIPAILGVVAMLAEKCKTIEDFRKSLADVLTEK